MDTSYLETFLLVCENKSFSKTAELQNLVQSTVSFRIMKIEEELGRKIFERNNKYIYLTKEGEVLKSYAKRIVELNNKAKQQISTLNFYDHTLSIGGIDSFLSYMVHRVLQSFLKDHPRIAVKIISMHSPNVLTNIYEEVIDLGFTTQPSTLTTVSTNVVFESELVLVTNPKGKYGSVSQMKIDELPFKNIINLNYSTSYGLDKDESVILRQMHHNERVSIDTYLLLISFLLEETDSLALIPEFLVRDHIRNGALKGITIDGNGEDKLLWKVYSIYLKANKRKNIIDTWHAYMRNNLKDS
ncbi:MAG TPA: hypothetical protein DCZ04_01970 [Syntrophorhabdus aromaticivorans]|jgi:LysR family transcriptional repressor of citA|nr:hypothetical protein [Syntrophorhabdus aromaticivorans]